MAAVSAATPGRPALRVAIPAIAGVAAALAIGTQASVAPVVMVCAAIYLFAGAIGHRWASWVGFAVSAGVLAPGVLLHDPWLSLIVLGSIQAGLVVLGLVRGAWRVPVNRLQLAGAVAFSALAVAASAGAGLWSGLIAIAGLAGHGAWDVWHHRADAVVPRSYALFCAVLDFALAALVTSALVASAV